jgi:hypothetical protein
MRKWVITAVVLLTMAARAQDSTQDKLAHLQNLYWTPSYDFLPDVDERGRRNSDEEEAVVPVFHPQKPQRPY